MIIDRSIQPQVYGIQGVTLPPPAAHILPGGLPLYALNAGTEDVLRLELVFHAGVCCQSHPLMANICLQILQEGTKTRTAEEIAETLEFYGAYLNVAVDNDFATLSLHCMYEYLDELLPVLADIISNPVFPANRFDVLLNKHKQSYFVNLQKVDYLARRRFMTEMFGQNHPLGIQLNPQDFESITPQSVEMFYLRFYTHGSIAVFLSGKADETAIRSVEKHLGFLSRQKTVSSDLQIVTNPGLHIEIKEDAVQSGIRLGCHTINRNHPDYAGLQVLNTVLGAYFGSRLMQSIREDLGYTYGIGSFIVPSLQHSYFAIGTETGSEVTMAALEAIEKEIEGLTVYPPDEEELSLVRNYMLGKLLKSTDGAFARADRMKTIVLYNLKSSFYEDYVNVIESISPEELLNLKDKYLKFDTFVKVIAGNSSLADANNNKK